MPAQLAIGHLTYIFCWKITLKEIKYEQIIAFKALPRTGAYRT